MKLEVGKSYSTKLNPDITFKIINEFSFDDNGRAFKIFIGRCKIDDPTYNLSPKKFKLVIVMKVLIQQVSHLSLIIEIQRRILSHRKI